MSLPQIIGLTLAEIVGDFGYKQFANNGGITSFAVGTAGYIGVVSMLIVSLQNSNILMVNTAWDGMSCLIENLSAFLFLNERFQNPIQYVGMFLVIIGLYFLKIPKSKPKPFVFPKFKSKKS